MKNIKIEPYNPEWPKIFALEAQNLKNLLGDNFVSIYHIGSTSIPNLQAKEDIDICCVVRNLESTLPSYIFKGELNISFRHYFSKKDPKINLHMVCEDHPFLELNLRFCDYLKSHDEDRIAYGNLKEEILKNPKSKERIPNHFSNYTLEKYHFINSILDKAGFDRLRLMFCMHPAEWEAYHQITQNFTIEPDHYHFVLYRGTKIIAASKVHNYSLKFIKTLPEYKDYDVVMEEMLTQWINTRKTS